MFIPVRPYRQWTRYSCAAAVLQMGVRYCTGERLGHLEAIHLTSCRPDGCTMAHLQAAFRWQGVRVRSVRRSLNAFRQVLDSGHLVVTGDALTWRSDHVILIVGFTETRFWIVDPIYGLPTMRDAYYVMRSADSAFAIG